MKIISKFLILLFACALISTPKVEAKVTLNGTLTTLSIVNTIANSLVAMSCVLNASHPESPSKFAEYGIETLIAIPTTYCLARKTESNTISPFVNGVLCLYNAIRAIEAQNQHTEINNSWSNTFGWAEEDKKKYFSNKISRSLAALYYALVAYQLNK